MNWRPLTTPTIFRLAALRQHVTDSPVLTHEDRRLNRLIIDTLESLMSDVTNLQDEQAAQALLTADVQSFIADVAAKVTSLGEQLAAAIASAGADPAAFAAITSGLDSLDASIKSADSSLTPAAPPPPPAVTSPVPLYTAAAGTPVDPSYTVAPFKGDGGETLYSFAGDTAGQPATGAPASGPWTEYAGKLTASPPAGA